MFVFGSFSKNVKLRPSEVVIDNIVFRLHYRITFWILVASTILVSSRQFIKEHIQCISDSSVGAVINTFCFFSTTFTVTRYHNSSYRSGVHVASPGVGPAGPDDEIIHHAYYQWVPFVLFGQAILFYFPHYLWKSLEKGRISAIVSRVKTTPFICDEDKVIQGYKIDSHETKKNREHFFKETYLSWTRLKLNRDWARNYFSCEALNVVNILFQIFIVDEFLQGNFFDLGVRWLENDEEVLESVFPKLTKCTFHKFGKSGSMELHDALCVMSLNIINEKVYTLLWFWFLLLLVITLGGLVLRLLTMFLHGRSRAFNRIVWREVNPGTPLKAAEIEMLATKLTYSDWLFLVYLGKNMDSRMFRKVVAELTQTLGKSLLTLRKSDSSGIAESFC